MHLRAGEDNEWRAYDVYLDGLLLTNCVEADDLGGWVRVEKPANERRTIFDLKTIYGQVQFRPKVIGDRGCTH
jgi:hypothetical protein